MAVVIWFSGISAVALPLESLFEPIVAVEVTEAGVPPEPCVVVVVVSEGFAAAGGVLVLEAPLPPEDPPPPEESSSPEELPPPVDFFFHWAYTVILPVTIVAAVNVEPLPSAFVFQPLKL